MSEIYRQKVMNHFKNPKNKGLINKPDLKGSSKNLSCGDEVEVTLKTHNSVIQEVGQNAKGCMIAKAFASMASDALKGEDVSKLRWMDENGFFEFLGCEPRNVRRKCSLTVFHALKNALSK